MSTQHIETVIVGGGQAGLSTATTSRLERPCLVLDPTPGSATTGGSSGTRSGCTRPPSTTASPAYPFPAPTWEFPQKDQVADYLESYATRFDLPVRTNTDRRPARVPCGRRLHG